MYRMTQFELYLNQFNTTIDASGAQLPDTQYDNNLGQYDLVFETNLAFSQTDLSYVFMFCRENDNIRICNNKIISLTAGDLSFGSAFSVQQSTYVQPGNTANNVALWSGASAPRVLVEEYLAYIAQKELGSANLVGAFDNYQTVYNSIEDKIVISHINSVLSQGNGYNNDINIPNFISNTTVAGDGSPLWNVYSYVLENFTERLTGATNGIWRPFLQVGDILDIKVTVSTPAIDASIADASGNPVNGNMSYTPVHPEDRVYLIKVHIVA